MDSTATTCSAATPDDVTSTSQVADNVTSTAGPKREATSDRDSNSNSNSDSDDDDCDEENYYGTVKKSSQFQELQQEEEQHPYMSLYEPLLFRTEPAEVQVYQSPSQQQQQQQQQPDETSSSSSYAVAEQSPPSQRINTNSATTTTFNRVKKRRKITTAAASATQVDYSDNNAAENVVQPVVHKDDARMNSNKRVASIVTTLTDCDIFTSNTGIEDDDDDASFDSRDDEAIIERMQKLARKKNKNRNSKPQSASAVTATDHIIVDEGNENCTDSGANSSIARKAYINAFDALWEEMYRRLVAYKKEHKDSKVPYRYKKDPQLGAWVYTQRVTHKKKKMSQERNRLLDSIGFLWNTVSPGTITAIWEEMYQRLVAYKTEHNDTMVPQNNKKYPQLGSWVNTQRSTYRNKKMTEKRKRLLDSIGFVWNTHLPGTVRKSGIWEEMYQRLVAYKKEHKDTKVPQSYKKDPQLGAWVKNQRMANKKKKITEERKRLLNSIGFAWVALSPGTITAIWEEMHQRLVAYKKEHKDTNVPQMYKKDPQLGRWVNNQRIAYRNKRMTEEHKRLLDSIGFVWNTRLLRTVRNNATWEEMYQRLVAYKTEHKDTKVPCRYKKDLQLGTWVYTQRVTHKKKKMSEERNRLLDSIGFLWNTVSPGTVRNSATWDEMHQCLDADKREHNNTDVPMKLKKNET